MKKGSCCRFYEGRAEWHCRNNRHLQGHHKRKVGVVIRFLWECSSVGGRAVRIDSVVVGIVVQYLGLCKGVLRLRGRE